MSQPEIFNEADEDLKDRLLQLVEEGDPTVILSSQYIESLNDLIKYEFISIENDRLKLTEKGLQAKTMGYKTVIGQKLVAEGEKKEDHILQQKTSSGISNRSFLILVCFLVVSLVALLTATNF
ncbi:hypothetical protein [Salinimicrobium xinjiangense]|uniref:hypothetical protein n=1 Tax=Salinimicrobium xinjiangense TaxID=438596 RepID=UPI000429DC97|nr:hypothetical protein [Salinimicrobium xinjiangense]